MSDVPQILERIEAGDAKAADGLMPLVYHELRQLAAQRLSREPPGQTIQATALVHDAFLRLVDVQNQQQWTSRGHFFAAAAEAMRRILVERARGKRRLKRGGDRVRQELDEAEIVIPETKHDVLALNEALEKFAREDRQKYELVKLRFFAGLTIAQAADAIGISESTADRHWAYARAWLYREIAGRANDGEE